MMAYMPHNAMKHRNMALYILISLFMKNVLKL